MRSFRLIIAVLLAVSLSIVPVSAAMAVMHVGAAEMSVSEPGSDCPCCDAAHKCATDICTLKCHSSTAISVELKPLTERLPQRFAVMGAIRPSPFSPQPDPPPPRS